MIRDQEKIRPHPNTLNSIEWCDGLKEISESVCANRAMKDAAIARRTRGDANGKLGPTKHNDEKII